MADNASLLQGAYHRSDHRSADYTNPRLLRRGLSAPPRSSGRSLPRSRRKSTFGTSRCPLLVQISCRLRAGTSLTAFDSSVKISERSSTPGSTGSHSSVKAPYGRWETFRNKARRLWNLYSSIAMPESVTRAAMRYINRIDIPDVAEGIRLEDYLRTYPEFSVDFPENSLMNNFFYAIAVVAARP